MQQKSRIVALASVIQEKTAQVDEYLSSNGLPSPTFNPSAPQQPELPEAIAACSTAVLEALDELQALMFGPIRFLLHQVDGIYSLGSLHAINHFDMASSIPIDGEAALAEVAEAVNLDEDSTKRILRHAATSYTFTEVRPGVFSHTTVSKTLAQTPLIKQWIGQAFEDMWPSSCKLVPSMVKWPASEEPTETAFNLASGAKDSYFVEVAKSPRRVRQFADAMNFLQLMPGVENADIVTSYDWNSLGNGLLVDIGGSDGKLAGDIVTAFPSIRAVVQDLPGTIEGAMLAGAHKLSDRVTFQVQDFLSEQTVKNADAYLLRMILHDWSDKYCARILRNLIPALKPGAKVLINDFCLPEPNTIPQYLERKTRCRDLAMKALFNAKERDLDDWRNLFLKADPRFKMTGISKTPSSPLVFIEVTWKG